ncbi:MAG TPA: flagella basal body P-ring formation protein FlgA [Polyangiaceae bacterium]|nr:flagella basal body P-ring formation protein FlgA [Polyangiaceae bacterium]
MIARAFVRILVVAALAGAAPPAYGAAAPRQVAVVGTRVHLGDLVADATPEAAAVDLGAAPAAGGSRLVTRADMLAALDARQVAPPGDLPDAVRVVRKARRLPPSEMDAIVRGAIEARGLSRGVTLAAVRMDRALDLAEGWTRVEVDVPRPPKKAGPFATSATASFFAGAEVVARIPVPIDLAISPDGAAYDAQRGSAVTLVVRRGLVEIRASAFAAADADVGDFIPVQLRPSGRVVRARLIGKDEALAVEGP